MNSVAFLDATCRIMIATTAFGLGIHDEKIRVVINFQLPFCFDDYIQQCARAGRDGAISEAYLLYNERNFQKRISFAGNDLRFFHDSFIIANDVCRRRIISFYFDQKEVACSYFQECALCDVCDEIIKPSSVYFHYLRFLYSSSNITLFMYSLFLRVIGQAVTIDSFSFSSTQTSLAFPSNSVISSQSSVEFDSLPSSPINICNSDDDNNNSMNSKGNNINNNNSNNNANISFYHFGPVSHSSPSSNSIISDSRNIITKTSLQQQLLSNDVLFTAALRKYVELFRENCIICFLKAPKPLLISHGNQLCHHIKCSCFICLSAIHTQSKVCPSKGVYPVKHCSVCYLPSQIGAELFHQPYEFGRNCKNPPNVLQYYRYLILKSTNS
jgi:hypothetical protein